MALNTDSHRAIERSQEIKISLEVNDLGGMYESYTCAIHDQVCCFRRIFIYVDHLLSHIMLAKVKRSHTDVVAVLKGNTKTLEQSDIQSIDGTILGRFHRNTVVSNASNSPILEFVLLPGEAEDKAIIGDPRTRDILANLETSDDPTELTTILYKSERRLHVVTKTLILLLAFKIFKDKACPKLKIPPINYHGLDELSNIQNITISKTSYMKVDNIDYKYFDVMEATTNQNLLTFMVRSDGHDGSRLEVSNLTGQRLFSAAPLRKFGFQTKLYMNETIEIGQVENYRLHAKSLMAKYNAELIGDGTQLWNDPHQYFKIRRWLTNHKLATITPDSSTSPRRVTVNIHPGVDTLHKALIFTFAMKLIYNFYGYYFDSVIQKQCLPQTSTDPTGPKEAAFSGQGYQGYQAMHPGQESSAGQSYYGHQATYPGNRAYDGPTYQSHQPPYAGERAYPGNQSQGAYAGQRLSGDTQFLFAAQAHVGESRYTAEAYGDQGQEPPPPGTS